MCVEQGCLLWWQDRAGFLDEWRNAFWSKFFSETPCKSFPILATPYLAKSSSKFLNHMVDEKEILQDSTWQNIYLYKTNIAQLWWAPLIRVCFKHFKDILTPKFCALCLVRTHPPHITAETTFPTELLFFFFIFSIFLLRYESSTLILYKELSSPIFQSCLSVSQSGIGNTCPDLHFVQYIKA